jgi:predicted Mrr-cat superfamily restriction endonuclease
VSIGWGKVGSRLLAVSLSRGRFADLVHQAYYSDEPNRIRSGATTGQLWRFIREMGPGSLVLIPHWSELHVARVTGEVTHDPQAEHWAFRRPADWMTGPHGVPREGASDVLRRRARTQITCLDISDLASDIEGLVPRR